MTHRDVARVYLEGARNDRKAASKWIKRVMRDFERAARRFRKQGRHTAAYMSRNGAEFQRRVLAELRTL